jgi:hypothetical protein
MYFATKGGRRIFLLNIYRYLYISVEAESIEGQAFSRSYDLAPSLPPPPLLPLVNSAGDTK